MQRNLEDLSNTILKLKHHEEKREDPDSWRYLEQSITNLLSKGIQYVQHIRTNIQFQLDNRFFFFSIPISLQFGITRLSGDVPDHMQMLRDITENCEENIEIRMKIRRWLTDDRELK